MTSRDFCYWLMGFFELSGKISLTEQQVAIVRNHLNLVFVHEIDPSIPGDPAELQAVHDGKPEPGFHLTQFYAENPHMNPNIEWPDGIKPRC